MSRTDVVISPDVRGGTDYYIGSCNNKDDKAGDHEGGQSASPYGRLRVLWVRKSLKLHELPTNKEGGKAWAAKPKLARVQAVETFNSNAEF